MTHKKRKLSTSRCDWCDIFSTVAGLGGIMCEYVPAEFEYPLCTAMTAIAKHTNVARARTYKSRLMKLLGFDEVTFEAIADMAVIAGGAVTYALNLFVPKQAVGDIDIFVLNGDLAIAKKLETLFTDTLSCEVVWRCTYDWVDHQTSFALIKFNNPFGKGIDLVVADAECLTPFKLIQRFDYDYVRCFYHQGAFNGLACAQEAHRTRTVTATAQLVRPIYTKENPITGNTWSNWIKTCMRIEKIRQKGFTLVPHNE